MITDGGPVSGELAVPAALRSARFVPREQAGRREPQRVTPGAFRAAGLPVPEDPRQWNIYRLTDRRGYTWSPAIDAHVRRRGAELLGGSEFLCIDCDAPLAIDGSVWQDGFRRLSDIAAADGDLLDLSGCIPVRTPGHASHGPGWHLWYRADPDCPVKLGPLSRCPAIEIKSRATAPGTPGYTIRSEPDGPLALLPRWLSALAGPPRIITLENRRPGRGDAARRLEAVLDFLLCSGPGDGRNARLYWSACRLGELIAEGALESAAAEHALMRAAEENGHTAKHGEHQTHATILSGLRWGSAA
jgi:hypothetical protein